MNKIIAITGPNGSGKDYIGNLIACHLNECFKTSFAYEPKKLFFDLTSNNFFEDDRTVKESIREKFIAFAEGMKNILDDRSVWANMLIKKLNPNDPTTIITDLRMKEEYDALVNYCKENSIQLLILEVISKKDFEYPQIKSDFTINNISQNHVFADRQVCEFLKNFVL